jgi:hypothetical protein
LLSTRTFRSYKQHLADNKGGDEFFAHTSEQETINKTIMGINEQVKVREDEWESMRNFASWVAHEEVITVPYTMQVRIQSQSTKWWNPC